jgi:predicted transcriptional regulator
MAVSKPSESESKQGAAARIAPRATTTAVRLDPDEVAQLDRLAEQFAGGDRSATIRLALRRLETEGNRARALDEYLAEAWGEHGGVDEKAVAEAGRRYFS